ncbi:Dockerin type I repeat protein [Stieleria maiorica]|uniref:Dockerin type I repeat protein n=1 Tax=Stieleria maiorica TaxID=2795974 RepID=A0A5B9MM81_9BACT|nr:dockerin type I domain-containing protein [Stieleria maiorica]QEG02502.1 Dockerin type I repeat protein [Stieleria maiorica]
MEERRLLASDLPFGATPVDTAEFMLGTVTVTPVFFESDGSIDPQTQDWTEAEIDEILAKIRDSVDWWSDLLATQTSVHTLDFVIDDHYARNPVRTGYEPIDNSSLTFKNYVGNWLTDLGYGDAPSIERAVALFNDSQRQTHQTDWAFTMFVVDSSDDEDGFFESGGFIGAFAYPGGLFMVVPSHRPTSTFTHEMGHIFWARDEYPGAGSWTDQRGYYNAQNLNASDNPTPGFEQQDSIMRGGVVVTRAFDNLVSPESTLAMVGWRDSDGDGIFDLADVPLVLDAIGSFDVEAGVYSIRGSAAVDTLANQNSAGMQSDITLARIGELQYRLDDGDWQTALSPDATQVEFDLQIPIETPFDQIAWRAIDTSTGITSDVLTGDQLTPVWSGIGGGYAYLDGNTDQQRDSDETLLAGTRFTVRRGDGSDLFHHSIQAVSLPTGVVTTTDDITLSGVGGDADGRIASLPATTGPHDGPVFHYFDDSADQWIDTWDATTRLAINAAASTGRVEIDVLGLDTGSYGLESGSYARVDVFDSQGNRIDRVTSDLVLAGDEQKLVIEDSLGRITRVVVYGHAETEILVSGIEFGQAALVSVGHNGAFSVDGLSDGDYAVEIVSPNLIYQFPAQPVSFQIAAGTLAPLAIAAQRVDSPRYNASLPGDVDGDQDVSIRDALIVINDLGRLGNRTLGAGETSGFDIDVNNDGIVSAIDALRVINAIQRATEGEGESISNIPPQSPQTSGSTQETSPAQSPWTTQPIAATAVDRVFGPHFPHTDWDRNIGPNHQNQKMLNYEGQRTSDQSPGELPSDRPTQADVQQLDETGENTGFERPLSGFLSVEGEIESRFAPHPDPEQLF